MVTILVTGDSTYGKPNKEDLEDISKYICSKNPKWFTSVEINYKKNRWEYCYI